MLSHHRDGLWNEPIGAVEHQRHTSGAGHEIGVFTHRHVCSELDALAAGILITLAQRRWRGRDPDAFHRRAGQHHTIGLLHQLCRSKRLRRFKHPQRPVHQLNDDTRRIVVRHLHRQVLEEDAVVIQAQAAVVNDAAVAFEAPAHHRNQLATIAAANVERVRADSAHQFHGHTLRRAHDEEAIVAFQRIDDQLLNRRVGHEQPRTEHALVRHHEVITKLRAHDRQ